MPLTSFEICEGTESDVDVIVAMDVHERGVVGGDLHLEDANLLVFERQMVTRLGGDLHLGCVLRNQSDGAKNECGEYRWRFMKADSSTRRRMIRTVHGLEF